MYTHLFGPVPSRRLGMSLGVDLVPHKLCSLNCVYCECGATTRLTHERREYVSMEELRGELQHYFSHHPDPDYITFSGAGEPTLHSGIGEVISLIKSLRPRVKLALITNGTLFSDAVLRAEVLEVDVVLPSLDAATPKAYRRINRPRNASRVEDHVEGLVQFGREFKGEIWLEVLILPGYNDDAENLNALGEAIRKIRPQKLQLNTLDRPGVIPGLRAARPQELRDIAQRWDMEEAEIVSAKSVEGKHEGFREDGEAAILELISRRACTLEDLEQVLGLHVNEINKYLRRLEASKRIERVEQERGIFYQIRL